MKNKDWAELYVRHVDMVYRLCYLYLSSPSDAEDAVQSVFLKLIRAKPEFVDSGHEKAWLLVTARNHCRDVLKSFWKSRRTSLDALPEPTCPSGESSDVLQKLLALPEKYKSVLYLHYYEGYKVKEIAQLLSRNESTILTQLSKGRALLKLDLKGEL